MLVAGGRGGGGGGVRRGVKGGRLRTGPPRSLGRGDGQGLLGAPVSFVLSTRWVSVITSN